MMGWPVARKCFVACLFFDESQHPTWPQTSHSRRCTQVSPIFRHSSHPFECGRGFRISSRCVQTCVVAISIYLLPLSGCGCQLLGRLELPLIQSRVQSTPLQEIRVPPLLDHLTMIHDQDEVGC